MTGRVQVFCFLTTFRSLPYLSIDCYQRADIKYRSNKTVYCLVAHWEPSEVLCLLNEFMMTVIDFQLIFFLCVENYRKNIHPVKQLK